MKLYRLALVLGLFAVSACIQDAAEITYRGDEFYGRIHDVALDNPNHQTYPVDSPRLKRDYARPVEPAKVETVKISDLPPAQQAAATAQAAAPQQQASIQPQNATANRFIWPVVGGKIISHFGPKPGGRSNDGINVSVAEGEPVWAAAGGKVVYAGNDLKGYGNMIIIRHTGGWMTAYAHARSLAVRKDDNVKQGDIIAYVGTSGGVPTPQLHFAIRNGRTPIDPELYLPRMTASQ